MPSLHLTLGLVTVGLVVLGQDPEQTLLWVVLPEAQLELQVTPLMREAVGGGLKQSIAALTAGDAGQKQRGQTG